MEKIDSKKDISIAVFTVHKSASMFIYKICKEISIIKGIDFYTVHNSKNSDFYISEKPEIENKRGIFAPIRFLVPTNEKCKKILHLRDPRDVMTSLYYSHAYSHSLSKENTRAPEHLKKRRKRALEVGIDGYVLDYVNHMKGRYLSYIEVIDGFTFVKYEDMVTDFPSWVRSFTEPFGFDDAEDVVGHFIDKYAEEFKVESEDVHKHKRQVLPGDHKRKLKPETIDILNSEFSEVLKALNYQ